MMMGAETWDGYDSDKCILEHEQAVDDRTGPIICREFPVCQILLKNDAAVGRLVQRDTIGGRIGIHQHSMGGLDVLLLWCVQQHRDVENRNKCAVDVRDSPDKGFAEWHGNER